MSNFSDYSILYNNVWGTVECETNKILCNTKDELEARIMALFTNLNKDTIRKVSRRFQSRLEAMVKTNGDFFK